MLMLQQREQEMRNISGKGGTHAFVREGGSGNEGSQGEEQGRGRGGRHGTFGVMHSCVERG